MSRPMVNDECPVCGVWLIEENGAVVCPNERACDSCGELIHDRGDGLCSRCREEF